jgi:hypothetical protein
MGALTNKEIANSFKDIKIIISAGYLPSSTPYEVENDTLLLRPSYQAKDVRMVNLEIKDKKITDWNFESRNLALDIEEDEEIKKIIPRCFSNKDCEQGKASKAVCINPGNLDSFCEESQILSLDTILITDKECPFCHTQPTEDFLRRQFPQITFTLLDYKEEEASTLLDKYDIDTLPVFILPQDIEKEAGFDSIANFVQKRKDVYFLRKEVSGIFLFLKRELLPQRIDIFITPGDPHLYNILNILKEVCSEKNIELNVHFFLFKRDGNFISKGGRFQLEEIERLIAIKKLYPEKFWDYLILRAKDIQSTWWPDILESLGIDYKKVKNFINHPDFRAMLEGEAAFAQDLRIKDSIAILLNNKLLFRIVELNKEELIRLLKYASIQGVE